MGRSGTKNREKKKQGRKALLAVLFFNSLGREDGYLHYKLGVTWVSSAGLVKMAATLITAGLHGHG